jgi:hypothetical protein
MEMSLWYCPKCDRPTQNWRVCSCGTPAVYQRFIMWAVEHEGELPACYTPNKACSRRVPRRGVKMYHSEKEVSVGRTRG